MILPNQDNSPPPSSCTTSHESSSPIDASPKNFLRESVLSCQFSSWYTNFRKAPKMTPKSIIIPLPSNFKDYLLSDGVHLPTCCENNENNDFNDGFSSCSSSSSSSSSSSQSSSGTTPSSPTVLHSFPTLTSSITEAIQTLGGSVFPKLNWSSPKDASWINNGSLKCTSTKDVYLLLKSSDFIVHDLEHALVTSKIEDAQEEEEEETTTAAEDVNLDYYLVLRKWCHFHKSMEFRCFVKDDHLVAISQRDYTQYYPHLILDRKNIQTLILNAFRRNIHNRFPLSTYVVDIYVDQTRNKVYVIDFNVWDKRTDALLFDWEELNAIVVVVRDDDGEEEEEEEGTTTGRQDDNDDEEEGDEDERRIIMRVVEREKEVRCDPLASYRAPIDTVCLAGAVNGGGDVGFEEFMKMCKKM